MFQTLNKPAQQIGVPFLQGAQLINAVPQQPPPISVDTPFDQLPEEYRGILERTSTDYKKPMHDGLDTIARYNPKVLEELHLELRRTNLIAMQLKCRQEQLMSDIKPLLEEAKSNLRNVGKYGKNGLLQIQDRGGIAGGRPFLLNEELPTSFYREAVGKIEKRLLGCATDIDHLQKQLSATMAAMNDYDPRAPAIEGMGVYGQQMRIVPQQLVQLIQHQREAFVRVAASVAEVHRETDAMRDAYRHLYFGGQYPGGGGGGSGPYHAQQSMDPFAREDKIEEANERLRTRRLQDEEQRHNSSNTPAADNTQQQPSQQPQQQSFQFNQPGAAAPAAPAAAGGFGFGAFGGAAFGSKPAATTATTTSFGAPAAAPAFGAPAAAPAFGAPAAAPAFGAPAAAPAFGAPATTSAFGAPAAAPAFGAPATTPTFGAPAAAPSFGAPAFGAPAFNAPSPVATSR